MHNINFPIATESNQVVEYIYGLERRAIPKGLLERTDKYAILFFGVQIIRSLNEDGGHLTRPRRQYQPLVPSHFKLPEMGTVVNT